MLAGYATLTLFLKVDEAAIAERVTKAAMHRDPSWGEYIKTKGKTADEIAAYYTKQQQNQLALLADSTLPYLVCDTTHHDYAATIHQILDGLHLR